MSLEGPEDLLTPPRINSAKEQHGTNTNAKHPESPSGSFSGSHNDSERSRSFGSHYRQSAILEMGSAVPMEIVNPQEPKEIQIQHARGSMTDMDGLLSGLSNQRDILKRLVKEGNESSHTAKGDAPRKQFQNDESDKSDYYSFLGQPWSVSTPARPVPERLNFDFPLGPPPGISAPLSPLHYPPSQNRTSKSGTPQSTTGSVKDSDEYATAREFSSDGDERDYSAPNITLPEELDPYSPNYRDIKEQESDSMTTSPSRQQRRSINMTKLRQIIDEEDKLDPQDSTQHSRSFSEPTHMLHPLPEPPSSGTGDHNAPQGSAGHSGHPSASNLPNELLQELSNENSSGYPVRKSSRHRGYDTIAPRVALKGEISGDPDTSHPSGHSTKRHSSKHSSKHTPADPPVHHHKSYSDQPTNLQRQSSSSRKRRNFTKKSIENMMQKKPSQYDIEDIGLPTPERKLMEKFIDSLSKLSIEVQMDEGKREEGLRRLNNALRALEGWI